MALTPRRMVNPQIEELSRAELLALQERRLIAQVRRAYERIPFYRKAWPKEAATLSSMAEFREIIPFQSKQDLLVAQEQMMSERVAQPGSQVVEDFRGIQPREDRPVPGDEALAGEDGRGFGDADVGKQGGIDLAELHPEAADFHLAVRPAEALERAVGQPTGEVAGAVVAGQAG